MWMREGKIVTLSEVFVHLWTMEMKHEGILSAVLGVLEAQLCHDVYWKI